MEKGEFLSLCIFTKDQFPGREFFLNIFAIENAASLPYIVGWNPEKRRICILIRYVMVA